MPTLAAPPLKKNIPPHAPRKKRWTVPEFYQLAEQGWFDSVRAMLLDGEIVEMPVPNPPHVMSVTLADNALRAAFPAGHVVRVQQPLPLGLWTDPVPDLAVVAGSARDFASHPTSALLIVEVSDTSLAVDLGEKAFLYAAGGIHDYWVVDVNNRQLIVFRDPIAESTAASGFRFSTRLVLDASATIAPLAAPQAAISVSDLLP